MKVLSAFLPSCLATVVPPFGDLHYDATANNDECARDGCCSNKVNVFDPACRPFAAIAPAIECKGARALSAFCFLLSGNLDDIYLRREASG